MDMLLCQTFGLPRLANGLWLQRRDLDFNHMMEQAIIKRRMNRSRSRLPAPRDGRVAGRESLAKARTSKDPAQPQSRANDDAVLLRCFSLYIKPVELRPASKANQAESLIYLAIRACEKGRSMVCVFGGYSSRSSVHVYISGLCVQPSVYPRYPKE